MYREILSYWYCYKFLYVCLHLKEMAPTRAPHILLPRYFLLSLSVGSRHFVSVMIRLVSCVASNNTRSRVDGAIRFWTKNIRVATITVRVRWNVFLCRFLWWLELAEWCNALDEARSASCLLSVSVHTVCCLFAVVDVDGRCSRCSRCNQNNFSNVAKCWCNSKSSWCCFLQEND